MDHDINAEFFLMEDDLAEKLGSEGGHQKKSEVVSSCTYLNVLKQIFIWCRIHYFKFLLTDFASKDLGDSARTGEEINERGGSPGGGGLGRHLNNHVAQEKED